MYAIFHEFTFPNYMKFKKIFLGVLVAIACWIGTHLSLKAYSDYVAWEEQKKLQAKQAQDKADLNLAIALDAEAASLMKQSVKEFNPNTWKQMIEKWEKSSQLLNGIQKDSLVYDQAQKGLIVVNSSLSYAKQKLSLEEKAQADLNLAISLDAEAAKTIKQEQEEINLNADLWKQTIEKWNKSSQLLAGIPKSSIAYAQAQKGLVVVNSSLSTARQKLKNEEISISLFEKALSIDNSIFKNFDKYKEYTLVELLSLKKQAQEGIKALSGVYQSSSIAALALEMVDYYNQNIYQLNTAISKIQQCMKDNKDNSLSRGDYCNTSVEINSSDSPFSLTPTTSYVDSDSDDIYSEPIYLFNRSGTRLYRSSSTNVRSYIRKDGKYVKSYTRSTSGTKASGFGMSRSVRASG